MASSTRPYDRCVFVNCPFDSAYKPLLDVVLFTIHDCGFIARTALENKGAAELRLDKIVRIIRESRWSIHDISRVDWTPESPLPRFNMAFECGLALGIQRFGGKKDRNRDFLILAGKPYEDKQTLSDLAGQDAAYHDGRPDRTITAVRSFLASKSLTQVRGAASIGRRCDQFRAELPDLARKLSITEEEILSFDYVPDLLHLMISWQRDRSAEP